MLSYQHMYHAGCLADVQKHAALAIILSKMVEKEKPISYMETHAGRGLYDLHSPEAQKTGEAKEGILSIDLPKGHPYTKILEEVRDKYGKGYYPGSPLVAKTALRREDKLHLMELHPKEHEVLSETMNYYNVAIHKQDGYKQVLAISPPKIRRGFVLVDPSYELKEEYKQAAEFIVKLNKKWPEAVVMIWYPVLQQGTHEIIDELLRPLPKFWKHEIKFKNSTQRALGTGLICINLPYGVEEDLKNIRNLI